MVLNPLVLDFYFSSSSVMFAQELILANEGSPAKLILQVDFGLFLVV